MILRRITEHVKAQNWTAVALDFLIVVVGVYVGLQFSNWNDARRAHEQEQVYLQRMHDEAKAGIDDLLGYVEGYFVPRVALFHETIDLLNAPVGETIALTDAQCDVIGNMHDFIAFPFQFPSLAEMETSGQLGLIRDAALRRTLTEYRLMQDQNAAFIANLNTELSILPNEFPEYFQAKITQGRAGEDLTYINCEVAGMQHDRRFLNHFADTASRYNGYYNIVIDRETRAVKNIHAALDAALGISHEEE